MNPGGRTQYIGRLFLVYIAEGTVLPSYCGLDGCQTTPLVDLIHQECPVGQPLLQPASTKDFSILDSLSSVSLICLKVRVWKARIGLQKSLDPGSHWLQAEGRSLQAFLRENCAFQ